MKMKKEEQHNLSIRLHHQKIKEVIHPQVPLRIPCDDLTHLTDPQFGVSKGHVSLKACSVDLTGGVCKEQGHIHRKMLTSDY